MASFEPEISLFLVCLRQFSKMFQKVLVFHPKHELLEDMHVQNTIAHMATQQFAC